MTTDTERIILVLCSENPTLNFVITSTINEFSLETFDAEQ